MSLSENAIKYMILILCAAALCIAFSDISKKIAKVTARGLLGLAAIGAANVFLGKYGLALGINAVNGILIGALGLPALIGLYIIKLITL